MGQRSDLSHVLAELEPGADVRSAGSCEQDRTCDGTGGATAAPSVSPPLGEILGSGPPAGHAHGESWEAAATSSAGATPLPDSALGGAFPPGDTSQHQTTRLSGTVCACVCVRA